MLITNMGKECSATFYTDDRENRTAAYDDEGNSYLSHANAKFKMGLQSVALSSPATITFPQDIPLKVRLQIEKIDPKATKMSLIKILMRSEDLGLRDKFIQIRNLEFERQ